MRESRRRWIHEISGTTSNCMYLKLRKAETFSGDEVTPVTRLLRTCVERRRQILRGLPREGGRAMGHQHGERDKLDNASRNVDFLHSFQSILK